MDGIQTDLDLIVALSKENRNSIKDYFFKFFYQKWVEEKLVGSF